MQYVLDMVLSAGGWYNHQRTFKELFPSICLINTNYLSSMILFNKYKLVKMYVYVNDRSHCYYHFLFAYCSSDSFMSRVLSSLQIALWMNWFNEVGQSELIQPLNVHNLFPS